MPPFGIPGAEATPEPVPGRSRPQGRAAYDPAFRVRLGCEVKECVKPEYAGTDS